MSCHRPPASDLQGANSSVNTPSSLAPPMAPPSPHFDHHVAAEGIHCPATAPQLRTHKEPTRLSTRQVHWHPQLNSQTLTGLQGRWDPETFLANQYRKARTCSTTSHMAASRIHHCRCKVCKGRVPLVQLIRFISSQYRE